MGENKNKEKKEKVLGSIASIQTLLERYPVLLTADSDNNGNGNTNVSMSFLMALLGMLNVTQQDIVTWMARIISSKSADGILNTIEEAVKVILLTNIKSLYTCSVDPLISDELLGDYTDINGQPAKGKGLEIDLEVADIMNILSFCPLSYEGEAFYFDNSTDNAVIREISDLWKSRDFNAFLWYVINRAPTNKSEERKRVWDNRCRYFKNREYSNNFFADNANAVKYFTCEYIERSENITKASNVLKIYLNPERYRYRRKTMNIDVNRTIFEFNYDFIYSLKLFDSKTLTAQIVNAVLGLSSTITGNMTIQHQVVQEKIHEAVRRILEDDDDGDTSNAGDSYFKFSNDEYNTLLDTATKKYNGKYQTGENSTTNVSFDIIKESIQNINWARNTDEEIEAISNVFETAARSISNDTERTVTSNDWGVAFSIETNLLKKFIEELSSQLIITLLSPKVAILYAVNAYIMKGNVDDLESWETFFGTFGNLIKSVAKKIKDIIIQELYAFAMEKLKPLLELYTNKLLLETIRDYKDLLVNLKRLCLPSNSNGGGTTHLIDNVDYADIIPTKNKP